MIRFRVAEGVTKGGAGCKQGLMFQFTCIAGTRNVLYLLNSAAGFGHFSTTTNNNYTELNPSWDNDSRSTGHKFI